MIKNKIGVCAALSLSTTKGVKWSGELHYFSPKHLHLLPPIAYKQNSILHLMNKLIIIPIRTKENHVTMSDSYSIVLISSLHPIWWYSMRKNLWGSFLFIISMRIIMPMINEIIANLLRNHNIPIPKGTGKHTKHRILAWYSSFLSYCRSLLT